MDWLFDLFGTTGPAPHGYCLLWEPSLIWTHIIADPLIAAAYFSIPLAIVRFVTRRRDIAFSWVFWLFALFIVACGTTHLVAIWTLYDPVYGFEALVKVVTAIASVGTAMVLWPLIPNALAIPSPLQLRQTTRNWRAASASATRRCSSCAARWRTGSGRRRRSCRRRRWRQWAS